MVQSNIARKYLSKNTCFLFSGRHKPSWVLWLYLCTWPCQIVWYWELAQSIVPMAIVLYIMCSCLFLCYCLSVVYCDETYAQHIEHNRTMPTSSSNTRLTQGLCLARKRKSWTICKLCSFTNQSERKLRRREEMSVNGWVGVNWWQKDREAAGREKMAQHIICQIPQLKPL